MAQSFPFWSELNKEQQDALLRSVTLHTVPTRTVLHTDSIDCPGVFIIAAGQLAYIHSEQRKEATVWRPLDGDVCVMSALCMIKDVQFDIVVEKECDTSLWVIPAATWQKLMDSSTAVASYTTRLMASRLSEAMWLMEQVMWDGFDKRLVTFLIQEHLFEESNELSITHERIAMHLGTVREVVTRMLRHFQQEGLVELSRGTIRLLDTDGLKKISLS